MPRRKKPRRCKPFKGATAYKPAGVPMSELTRTTLELDELEAMRLCDKRGLDQTEAAEKMNISRGTLQRLLYSGREKIIDSLINSTALIVNKGSHIIHREGE